MGTLGNRLGVSHLGDPRGPAQWCQRWTELGVPQKLPPPDCEAPTLRGPGWGWPQSPDWPLLLRQAGLTPPFLLQRRGHRGSGGWAPPDGQSPLGGESAFALGPRDAGCCCLAPTVTGTAEDPGMAPRPSLCGPQEARLLVAHTGGGTRRESRGAASGLPGGAGLRPLAALGSDAPSARADSRNSLRCLLCLLCDPRPGTNTQTLTTVNLGFQGPRPGGSGQRWPGRGCRVPDKTEQSAGGCGEGQPRPAARPAGGCVDRPSAL